MQRVSGDGFNGGSDSYLQFRDTCGKRRNINLILDVTPQKEIAWGCILRTRWQVVNTPTTISNDPLHKTNLQECFRVCERERTYVFEIDLAQDRNECRAVVNTAMNLRAPQNSGQILDQLRNCQLLKKARKPPVIRRVVRDVSRARRASIFTVKKSNMKASRYFETSGSTRPTTRRHSRPQSPADRCDNHKYRTTDLLRHGLMSVTVRTLRGLTSLMSLNPCSSNYFEQREC